MMMIKDDEDDDDEYELQLQMMMVTVVNVVNENRDYQETSDVVSVSVWKSLEDIVPKSEIEYMAYLACNVREEGT